jgi:hypothetical protein
MKVRRLDQGELAAWLGLDGDSPCHGPISELGGAGFLLIIQ